MITKIVSRNSITAKIGSLSLSIYMVAMSFAGLTVFPTEALAATLYLISGTATTNGLTVSVTGQASANHFTGQLSAQQIAISWDNGSHWSTLVGPAGMNVVDGSNNGIIASTTYATSTTFATPGAKTIIVGIFHSQPSGHEGGLNTVTFTVNVSYQCSDGVDNDGDGMIDYPADPGCTSATDNTEAPNPAPTTGTLIVKKVVSGGSAATSSFMINVINATSSVNVPGSPAAGSEVGTTYTLAPGGYTVSEPANSHYSSAITGTNCLGGNATVNAGTTTTCTVTNTYHNAAPTADNKTISTNEDTPVSSTVSGADADGDVFTFGFLTAPTHGTLTSPLNPTTGAFTYTPNANYFGSDSFTFNTTDGVGTSAAATVSITVNPVNDAPNAVDDSASVNEDSATTTINVLTNDTDTEGDTLTITGVTNPAHGTVAINGSSVDYMPAPGYSGPSDSFTYTISDGNGGTDTATVNVSVSNVNDAPVAVNDSYSQTEDTQLLITVSGVLLNDTDADGDTLHATLINNVSHGTLNFDGTTGGFTYDPAPNYCGPDSFTYKANDGQADSNEATAAIDVTCVNDAPVAQNGSIDTDQNAATSSNLIATDTEGSALTYDVVTYPLHGWFTAFASSTGAFTYSPTFGYLGSDSFTFKANDGSADSNTATVSINVHTVAENTFAKCTDGFDNDGDERVDLNDSDCAQFLPQLVIVKSTVNGDGTFDFTVIHGEADFAASTSVTTISGNGQSSAIVLHPNTNGDTYVVTEQDKAGWSFDGSECLYTNSFEEESQSVGEQSGHSEIISNPGAGDVITCTFHNTKLPQCSDGIDNDGDGFTDYGEGGDNNCLSPQDNNESPEGTTQCSDGADNDHDGTADIDDKGCHSDQNQNNPFSYTPNADNEADTGPTPPSGGGGGGGNGPIFGGSNGPIGQVLGASTSLPELPAGCSALLHTFMRQGRKANNAAEVKLLQQFLNDYMKTSLPVSGTFGPATDKAVRDFQVKHSDQVLTPWGLNGSTGFVYLTTQRWINLIHCSTLNIPVPELVPFHE